MSGDRSGADWATLRPVMRGVRYAYLIVAWAFLVLVLAQVFLAGMAIFMEEELHTEGAYWAIHVGFGYTISWLPLVLLVLVFFARFPRNLIYVSILLVALTFVQTTLPIFHETAPGVSAFHPVLALVIFAVSWIVATWSRAQVPPPLGSKK